MHKKLTEVLQGIAKKKSLNYNLAIRKTKQHWTQKMISDAEKRMTPAKFKLWMEDFDRHIKEGR